MKIKTGDNVIVLTGKNKGQTGKVIKAFPREDKVLIEGVNMRKRHKRPARQGGKGQIVEMAHPIHVSNVRKTDSEAPKPKKARVAATKKTTKAEKAE